MRFKFANDERVHFTSGGDSVETAAPGVTLQSHPDGHLLDAYSRAVIKAVETVDDCVRRVAEATVALGGKLLITADHGNCELMIEEDGSVSPDAGKQADRCFAQLRQYIEELGGSIAGRSIAVLGASFKPNSDDVRFAPALAIIRALLAGFPGAHCLWMYRDYRDVANSSIRKFTTATGAVRRLCNGESAEGWFEEAASPAVRAALREVYDPAFSRFDYACLTWWARNRLVIESGIIGHPAVMTHASVPVERRDRMGVSEGLVRLSCGVEDAEDLIEDLEQALRGVDRS